MFLSPLLVARHVQYKRLKWQYFMWDQCYFFHYTLMAAVVLRSESEVVFKVLFSLANGPILFALIMWRNSLALHDFDKSVSVFLHLTPALATWCWRWFGHDPVSVLALGAAHPPHCSFTAAEGPGQGGGGGGGLDWQGQFGAPLAYYAIWQVIYFVKTEVLDKDIIAADPEIMTCQRWIGSSRSWLDHPYLRAMLAFLEFTGLFGGGWNGSTDEFKADLDSSKASLVYTLGNLGYESFTLLLAMPLYHSYNLHTLIILVSGFFVVWNAGTWYTDRFPLALAAAAARDAEGGASQETKTKAQ